MRNLSKILRIDFLLCSQVYHTVANVFPILAGSQSKPMVTLPGPNTVPTCPLITQIGDYYDRYDVSVRVWNGGGRGRGREGVVRTLHSKAL